MEARQGLTIGDLVDRTCSPYEHVGLDSRPTIDEATRESNPITDTGCQYATESARS